VESTLNVSVLCIIPHSGEIESRVERSCVPSSEMLTTTEEMSAELETSAALALLLLTDFTFLNNFKKNTENSSILNALLCFTLFKL
jgi:hypothetical protein